MGMEDHRIDIRCTTFDDTDPVYCSVAVYLEGIVFCKGKYQEPIVWDELDQVGLTTIYWQ